MWCSKLKTCLTVRQVFSIYTESPNPHRMKVCHVFHEQRSPGICNLTRHKPSDNYESGADGPSRSAGVAAATVPIERIMAQLNIECFITSSFLRHRIQKMGAEKNRTTEKVTAPPKRVMTF